MIQPVVKVDTREFEKALQRYRTVSKRSYAEIVNKKACLIALGAIKETHRASRQKIESEIGKFVTVQETNAKGKTVNRRKVSLNTRKGHSAPLAELIINARRARAGEPGLGGQELAAAVRKMVASRLRSIAFLASGWLPVVKILVARITDRKGLRLDRSAKWFGVAKGRAIPATIGIKPTAVIENAVDKGQRPEAFIVQGLQRSLNKETASMNSYIEKKLSEDAKAFH